MKKIMINDHYGLTQAVLEGRKTMTRRMIPCNACNSVLPALHFQNPNTSYDDFVIKKHAHYKIGEEVAVSQRYVEIEWRNNPYIHHIPDLSCRGELNNSKGWCNKMFVRANLMPHRVRITNIKVERLQDISDQDCIREGIRIVKGNKNGKCFFGEYTFDGWNDYSFFPKTAFRILIEKISGKGTWDKNPYLFVYEFELIK